MTLRILVTGSREWWDKRIIGQALGEAIGDLGRHLIVPIVPNDPAPIMRFDQVTVVHGAARGADTIAGNIASAWGMRVEAHPADWDTHGKSAGHRRNAEMVALGADVCLAFPLGRSSGTRSCARLAEAAGIPVRCYETTSVTS